MAKTKSEHNFNLNLFKKEKEEKENLFKKCQNLEEKIKVNIDEIAQLKHQNNLSSSILQSPDQERILLTENENKKLQNDFNMLNEKLRMTEKQLETFKSEALLSRSNSNNLRNKSRSVDLLTDAFDNNNTDETNNLRVS